MFQLWRAHRAITMKSSIASSNKSLLIGPILLILALVAFFGGGVKALILRSDVLSVFAEFTNVTSKNFPSEAGRDAEMLRIVKKAEDLVGGKCVVTMVAHNPGTIHRNDELKFGCGMFSNPGSGNLVTIAEFRHRENLLKVYDVF